MIRFKALPITSIVKNLYLAEYLITVQGKQSKAMADQLITISKLRFSTKIGTVNAQEMDEIERIIRLRVCDNGATRSLTPHKNRLNNMLNLQTRSQPKIPRIKGIRIHVRYKQIFRIIQHPRAHVVLWQLKTINICS